MVKWQVSYRAGIVWNTCSSSFPNARVTSAVMKRAGQSPRILLNFFAAHVSKKDDHWSTGHLCAGLEL